MLLRRCRALVGTRLEVVVPGLGVEPTILSPRPAVWSSGVRGGAWSSGEFAGFARQTGHMKKQVIDHVSRWRFEKASISPGRWLCPTICMRRGFAPVSCFALLPLELNPTHDEHSGARTIAPLGESYLRNRLQDYGRRFLRSLLGVFFAKHLL